jgi:hypothetical protein
MAIIKIGNPAIDLDAAEIPNLSANKITSDTLADARVPDLNTSKITAGTLSDARLPANALNSNIDLTNLSASNLTSGTLADARFPSTLPAISGANLTNLPGGNNTPSFLAYKSASDGIQTNSDNVDTKVTFPTEEYDIGSCYNTSNSIFTPGTAGKYLITANVSVNLYSNSSYMVRASIFKNGAVRATNGLFLDNYELSNNNRFNLTIIDTANTTDYYEVYFYANGNSTNVYIEESSTPAGLLATSFSGFKIIT